MITYRGEQIEVWDAHAHMGERQQIAIHQNRKTDGQQAFGRREDNLQRVIPPWLSAVGMRDPAPEVDDLLSLQVDGDRGASLTLHRLPHLAGDVHDLAGLARVAAWLFGRGGDPAWPSGHATGEDD